MAENNFISGTEECSTEKWMTHLVQGFPRFRCCREENFGAGCDLAVSLRVQQQWTLKGGLRKHT